MSVNKEEHNSAPPDVKDEDNSTKVEEKAIDESSKDSGKDSAKENSAKGESGKEESGKSESEDDDDEEEMALLDRPVEVTGCRARKKVERLEISFATPKEKQIEIPDGKGQKLGDCPRIEHQIQKNKVADLKNLHRILFSRMGSVNEIKKNLRKFSGFTFEKKSQDFIRKKGMLEKQHLRILKNVCEILDLERGGTKEDIINRILDFLMNPKDSGKQVIIKKKSARKEKKKGGDKKTKNSDKKTKSKKEVSSDDPESQDDSAADSSIGGSDEDKSDEAPKKKSKVSKTKEAPKGKTKKGEKNVKEEKKSTKGSKRKREESDNSSEDETSVVTKQPPSDEEIAKLVKQILDAADLQEITMKKVIEQVFDAYPDCDLSHKKEFIKTTIKSVIS